MGVSAVVSRSSAGSDGSLGGRPCRVCSGEPCGVLLRLYKGHVSTIDCPRSQRLLQKDGPLRFNFWVGGTNLALLRSFA